MEIMEEFSEYLNRLISSWDHLDLGWRGRGNWRKFGGFSLCNQHRNMSLTDAVEGFLEK